MCEVDIEFKNGNHRHYVTTLPQDQAMRAAGRLVGVARVEIHEATLMWPTDKEAPILS